MMPVIPVSILKSACSASSFSILRLGLAKLFFVFIVGIFTAIMPVDSGAQDKPIVLSADMLNEYHVISLNELEGWKYTNTFESDWLDANHNDDHWESINFNDFSLLERTEGKIEAWFRIKVTIDSSLAQQHLSFIASTLSALDLYLNGSLFKQYGVPHADPEKFKSFERGILLNEPVSMQVGEVYTIGVYFVDHYSHYIWKYTNRPINPLPRIFIANHQYSEVLLVDQNKSIIYFWLGPLLLLSGLFWLMYFQNKDEKTVFLVAVFTTALTILCLSINIGVQEAKGVLTVFTLRFLSVVSSSVAVAIVPLIIDKLLTNKISKGYRYLFWFFVITNCLGFLYLKSNSWLQLAYVVLVIILSIHLCIKRRAYIKTLQWVMLSGMLFTVFCVVLFLIFQFVVVVPIIHEIVVTGIYLSMPISMLIYFTIRFKNNLDAARANADRVIQLSSEKEKLIESQKSELEQQVKSRTEELEKSLDELKATQDQLVQQEKLASLGQLTAGIAHEIKNPLNFVNNFSEVSAELIDEALEEIEAIENNDHATETAAILADVRTNLLKIHEHGSRADSIVKSMLLHSRGGSDHKEPTPLNPLIKEYANLAFHGMRASKDPINVEIKLDLDESVGEVPLIAEDFSRVILNLCNNAFDAMRVKLESESKTGSNLYAPQLTLKSSSDDRKITIKVEDNGPGIPKDIIDKILQPFFTTKRGTMGTGLGLSISHDIIKSHGGSIDIVSTVGKGTTFIIILPV